MATTYIGFIERQGLFYNDTYLGDFDNPEEALAVLCKKFGGSYSPIGVMVRAEAEAAGWSKSMERTSFLKWVAANKHKFFTGDHNPVDIMGDPAPITPGPRKLKPQVCPEVWFNKPEVDITDYMAAVRAMCGDSKC